LRMHVTEGAAGKSNLALFRIHRKPSATAALLTRGSSIPSSRFMFPAVRSDTRSTSVGRRRRLRSKIWICRFRT
jgi:hypothetical protein